MGHLIGGGKRHKLIIEYDNGILWRLISIVFRDLLLLNRFYYERDSS